MSKRMLIAATAITALAAMQPVAAQDGGYYGGQNGGQYGGQGPDGGWHHRHDHGGGYPRATFFADPDFRGQAITMDHEVRKFSTKDMDDKISSIGIDSGAWQICEDDKFEGRCIIIDHSIARLSDIGWDDKISSARPVPPQGRGY